MATRVPLQSGSVRKAPRQQRSRATVDTIVEAAARVLARRGWADFTTNETASVGGVSVGSIYQYFPNKLALAEEIRNAISTRCSRPYPVRMSAAQRSRWNSGRPSLSMASSPPTASIRNCIAS
ncbi:TetR/AcrR family transcriptional regulator [Mesorhizobium sp. M7A.F.Ca.US.001.01.1.1]|nr:TetR/AcrR family transcriptional regulator [Mesorhizobium sp. M7A.F.Ca.US.001.01.1.1]